MFHRVLLACAAFCAAALFWANTRADDAADAVAPPPAAEAVAPAPAETDAAVAAMLADRVLGSPDAPVTMIEYASLTCGHCAHFHNEILPQLKADYIDTGKVKLVFRDYPLDQFGLRAAMLARCVDTSRYFPFVKVLFKTQSSWAFNEDPIASLAKTVRMAGITEQQFQACMDNTALVDGVIKKRLEAMEEFDIKATPTFIFTDEEQTRISGAKDYDEFKTVIDRLLAAAG